VEGVGDPGRWGIVHRLDRGTSGLLVVALDAGAYTGLRAAMGRREVTRTYLALVHGSSAAPTGTIDAPLGRDPRHPTRFRVDRSGRPARTHYRRLATWEGAGLALLEVRLETGRTHQIRVHTASIGHPVAGDPAYGRGGDGIPRLCLHAAGLRFTHPVTGGEVAVASPLPTDMADIVRGLGSPTTGEVPYR
jgi:23S rRNA pseudouridine1911/1915/1917 synthase